MSNSRNIPWRRLGVMFAACAVTSTTLVVGNGGGTASASCNYALETGSSYARAIEMYDDCTWIGVRASYIDPLNGMRWTSWKKRNVSLIAFGEVTVYPPYTVQAGQACGDGACP